METVKTSISLIVILVVNIANCMGYAFDVDTITQVVMQVIALGTLIYGVWKNHNFTQAAQDAQEILDAMKESGEDA